MSESVEAREHAELAVVLGVPRAGTDPWATLSTISTGLRRADDWSAADDVLLDIDWTDPALPPGDGHLPVPEAIATRLVEAASKGMLPPGVLYLTRRGFRFGALFRERVADPDLYGQAAAELGQLVLDALEDDDFPVARAGVPGFAFDEASTKVAQVQRLPASGCEVIVTGQDLYDAVGLARGEIRPGLPLDAALPDDIAMAVRQVGAWVQIAAEVVLVHILAMASALIGNTRCVKVRGFIHNLSLQFITLVKSSAGRTTVRKYLDPATQKMRLQVWKRRQQAEEENEKYEIQLAAWKVKVKRGKDATHPDRPSLGPRETLLLTEATTEALYNALTDTPRGLLWSSSEAHEILGVLGHHAGGGQPRSPRGS